MRTVEQGPAPPPACGTSAGVVEMSLRGKRRRVVRFGRGETMTGRVLRAGGVPAAGAAVRILELTETLVEIGGTTAGPDGSFSFAIPAGANRSLLAAFRSDAGDPALACSAPARLAVRAKARLRAKPRRLRAGRVVRFRGLVRGPLPPRGKLLDLQAFDGGQLAQVRHCAHPGGRTLPRPLSLQPPGPAAHVPLPRARAARGRVPLHPRLLEQGAGARPLVRLGHEPDRRRAAAASARPSGTGPSRGCPRPRRRRGCPGPSRRSSWSPC